MPHVENPALDANVIKIRARGYENTFMQKCRGYFFMFFLENA